MTQTVPASSFVLPTEEIESRPWQPFRDMEGLQIKDLSNDGRCVSGLFLLRPGVQEAPHSHALGTHHLWVVDGEVTMAGRLLRAGSYIHVPPGVTHTMHAGSGGATLFFVFDAEAPAAG